MKREHSGKMKYTVYHSVFYTNGTECDITKRPRMATVMVSHAVIRLTSNLHFPYFRGFVDYRPYPLKAGSRTIFVQRMVLPKCYLTSGYHHSKPVIKATVTFQQVQSMSIIQRSLL